MHVSQNNHSLTRDRLCNQAKHKHQPKYFHFLSFDPSPSIIKKTPSHAGRKMLLEALMSLCI